MCHYGGASVCTDSGMSLTKCSIVHNTCTQSVEYIHVCFNDGCSVYAILEPVDNKSIKEKHVDLHCVLLAHGYGMAVPGRCFSQ